jgi:capsular polysaccharide biosynthesis protein
MSEEERTIGSYLEPVRKHALLITILALLALVGGLIKWITSYQALPYQAEATIMFTPNSGKQIDINSGQFRDTGVDITRQQQNVGLLATSMQIANNVAQQAKASDDPELKALGSRGSLALHDQVSVQTKGAFLSVTAKSSSAEAATWLANSWAQEVVTEANALYASSSPNVNRAVDDVKSQLDKDEAALERFLADSSVDTLSQELTQTTAFVARALGSQAASSFTLYDAERQSIRDQISGNYSVTLALDEQLNEMRALRSRIQEGPDDPGALFANQVALLSILDRVVSGNSNSRVQLQLNVADLGKGSLTRNSQLSDIDSTIASVQRLQSDIRSQTANLEGRLGTPPVGTPGGMDNEDPALQPYLNRLSQLRSELESKRFELDQLTKTRDLDRDTYDLLRGRLAEQQVNQLVSHVVDIGAPADTGQTARSRSIARSLALTLGEWVLFAVALGCALAFLLNALRPNFNSNAILTSGFRRGIKTRLNDSSS